MISVKSDYAYPYPRIMASKGQLLRCEDMKALLAASQIEEYVAYLERTHYGAGGALGLDIDNIEYMLLGDLISAGKAVLDFAPASTKTLFESFMLRYYIELMKLILNIFGGVEREKIKEICSIYYPILSDEVRETLKACIDAAETKMDIINAINEINPRVLCGIHVEGIPSEAEAGSLLDRCYFQKLWRSIETLSSRDAEYARRLIGTEIDLINIMNLFRSAVHGHNAEKFIIPVNYELGGVVNSLFEADLPKVVSALSETRYGELASDGLRCYEETNSLLRFEVDVQRYLIEEHRGVFRGYPFHIGILLSFLKLKEHEVKDLISILIGIKYNLPIEERECLLVC
jgi:V/A-type H+-transporting ATPase subunit C